MHVCVGKEEIGNIIIIHIQVTEDIKNNHKRKIKNKYYSLQSKRNKLINNSEMVYFLIGAENIFGDGDKTFQRISTELGTLATIKNKIDVTSINLSSLVSENLSAIPPKT